MSIERSEKKKTVSDLTQKEILEDLDYWLTQTQARCPAFVDEMFDIIRQYTKELEKRLEK